MTENKTNDDEVISNWGLVIAMAKQFRPLGYQDMDDLIQAGFSGLMKGISTYEEGKGKKSTWLARLIRQEIVNEVWRNHKNSKFRGRNMEIPFGNPSDIEELIASKGYRFHHSEMNLSEENLIGLLDIDRDIIMLNVALAELGKRYKTVVGMLYGIGGDEKFSSRSLGKKLGISHTRVCQLHGEALRKLREKIILKRKERICCA